MPILLKRKNGEIIPFGVLPVKWTDEIIKKYLIE